MKVIRINSSRNPNPPPSVLELFGMETDDKSFSENPSRQERIINSIPHEKTRLRGQRVRGIPAVVESRLCLKRLPVVKTESLPPLPHIYTDMQGTETASEET